MENPFFSILFSGTKLLLNVSLNYPSHRAKNTTLISPPPALWTFTSLAYVFLLKCLYHKGDIPPPLQQGVEYLQYRFDLIQYLVLLYLIPTIILITFIVVIIFGGRDEGEGNYYFLLQILSLPLSSWIFFSPFLESFAWIYRFNFIFNSQTLFFSPPAVL